MAEYPQLGFFFFLCLYFTQQHTEVKHMLMSSGNIVRDLMTVTFFSLLYVLLQHELLCFPILATFKFTLVKSLSESNSLLM